MRSGPGSVLGVFFHDSFSLNPRLFGWLGARFSRFYFNLRWVFLGVNLIFFFFTL